MVNLFRVKITVCICFLFLGLENGYSQNTGATYKGTKRMFAAYNRIEKALGFKIR